MASNSVSLKDEKRFKILSMHAKTTIPPMLETTRHPRIRRIGFQNALGWGLGLIALALILSTSMGMPLLLLARGSASQPLGPLDWIAIRFTLLQAFLSALLSVGYSVFLARALVRQKFRGKHLLITLLGAPFLLPVLVAIIGLLAVFGTNGLVGWGFTALGLSPPSIYGLSGILLAHVFFNLPLATRMIMHGWGQIPAEQFRLAEMLKFSPWASFVFLEWPMLRKHAPGAFLVVFLICTTSFAVALALGGGPKNTTIELAIYQAFLFDFDLTKAAHLAGIQFLIGAVCAVLALSLTRNHDFGTTLLPSYISNTLTRGQKYTDILCIGVAALFLFCPLAMVIASSLPGLETLGSGVAYALFRSLCVAGGAMVLSLSLALCFGMICLKYQSAGIYLESLAYTLLAVSPLVVGTGLYILFNPYFRPTQIALPMTSFVNALLVLPFILRILMPALRIAKNRWHKLSESLGLTPFQFFWLVLLPAIRAPLGFAAGIAAALSIGDLGVIVFFADPRAPTLPLFIFQLLGAYKFETAAAAALILLVTTFGCFGLFDWIGRRNASA